VRGEKAQQDTRHITLKSDSTLGKQENLTEIDIKPNQRDFVSIILINSQNFLLTPRKFLFIKWVSVISAKNHKRQRRKRPSVTAKREKSQTPKVLNRITNLT